MREYDEITLRVAERVLKRSDEIVKRRQKRVAKIRHITYAVSGICAAIIVCIGAFHLSLSDNKLDMFSNNTEIPSVNDTNTTTTTMSTYTKTTVTKTITTKYEKSSSTIKTTAISTSETTPIGTEKTHITDSMIIPTQTKINDPIPVTTSQTAVTFTASSTTSTRRLTFPVSNTTFITSLTGSTNTIITSPTITTINIQENFRSYPCTFSVNNVQYEKEGSIIELNNIGDFIRNVPVNITISNNWLIIDRMEAYEIRNISIEEAIAVKLKDTDEYYLFRNMDYKKEDDVS